MKAFQWIGIIAVLLLCAMDIHAQKKYDKQLAKIDKQYNSGNYSKAMSALTKFKKSVTSGLGQTNPYMPGYYIREARVHLNQGILTDFENSLNNAVKSSFALYGDSHIKYAQTLVDVAETYNQYGYYRLSREYLANANNIATKQPTEDLNLKARLTLAMADALTGQGFCNDARALLRENEKFFASRAVEKETYVEDGKIKNRYVSEQELMVRYTDYSSMLKLIAASYAVQGNVNSADSAFEAARSWTKRNLRYMGETSLALVTINYLNAKMLAENNNGILPPEVPGNLDYSNMLNEISSKASAAVPLAHEVYLAYLDDLQRKSNNARYGNIKAEYERNIHKHFNKTSLMLINLKAIEFDAKLAKNQADKTESEALSIINSKSLPRHYSTTIRILEFLYEMSVKNKRYNGAENYLSQISEIKKELYGDTSPQYHLTRITFANFLIDYTNKIDEARKIFENSYTNLVSKEIGAWQKDHLNMLNHLATLYELADNYSLASSTLDKALYVARSKYSDTDPDFGVELDQIAALQIKLGQYDKAEQNINRSLKILEEYRKDDSRVEQYVHALETQAKLFGTKGLFDEAQANLDKSKSIIGKSKSIITNELSATEELASLLIQLGSYSATDDQLKKLIPEYEKLYGPTTIRLIEPLVNRGKILLARGEYTDTERTALRAYQIATQAYSETSTKSASVQKLLSDLHYTLGDYDKAEDYILKALRSQEKQFTRNHIEVARSLSQLALIKFYKGSNKDEVEKLMMEARDIIANKLGKDNPQYAEIMKNIAVLYISEKKYELAFNSLTIAESIWKAKTGKKNNINSASIYTLTGDVYYQQKNYAKAEEFYTQSKDLYEKFFSITHPEYVKVLSKLSKVSYMKQDFKKAKKLIEESLANYENFIKEFFPALSEREKAKYWNTIKGDFEFYNTLAFSNLEDFKDLTRKVYDYQLLTKALLLSSSIKIREKILNSTDEDLKNTYRLWLQNKEMLTLALSMGPQQLLENEIDPIALTQEVERLEKYLSEQSELFSQGFDNKKITSDDIRKVLKPNEVAVEMIRFRYFNHTFTDSIVYAALYIRNEFKQPKAVVLQDGKKMEGRNFKFYRNAMQNKIPDNNSYNVYWKPIEKEIGLASTIYLSADGVYNLINLEALATPDGKYILDNANIVLVSNTKDIYLNKVKSKNAAENSAFMFGNPEFYLASAEGAIPPLPGTEKEISQLQFLLKQKGWQATEYLEKNATEEKIKELNNPKIFHIATHGFYKPADQATTTDEMAENEAILTQNPLMRTGLLLKGAGDLMDKTDFNFNMENGILTAYEAMSLTLDKTDLVVLSACETGLGQVEAGEGVFGLQRSFLVAGAKVLVMSMFKVDDEATQKLMLKLYQKWLNSGNLRQSFIDAKKELRVEYPEPIYWGAFIMIGLE